MFKYLGIHKDSDLAFNPEISKFSDPLTINSKNKKMKKMNPDAVEYLPKSSPPQILNAIHVSCFIDNNHVSDKITRCSQSVIVLYCTIAPIIWYSKTQDTVESSTFGSEFLSL